MGRCGSLWCVYFVVTVGFTDLSWLVMLVLDWVSGGSLRLEFWPLSHALGLRLELLAFASFFGLCLVLWPVPHSLAFASCSCLAPQALALASCY